MSATTEKKPLLIQIPGEITPNVLPVSASAVGYDFVQGNYIYYATGSDSWVTAPPNTAGIQEYWQSTVNNNIFTTGSIAVTGSITGSNLILTAPASRILAPNGALVISSSAGIFITGSLVVSGTRSPLGTEQSSILFNGDLFVSGGIGLNDYLQLKPVGTVNIPTNTVGGYMYVSGSTNDIYFTQYQPGSGFNNTTRLRWLEGTLTTGLLHGGVLSTTNGSTTFSITSGSGLIVTYNASTTSDPYPTINFVSWPAYVSQSINYLTSSQVSFIGINASGGLIQQITPFSLSADSGFITIGRVLHQSGSVTNGTITSPIVSYGTNHWQDDFSRAFGPLKVSGHVLAASGSTLGVIKSGGDSYVIGRNYTTDPNNPNNVTSATDTAVTVSKIYRAYVSGSTTITDTGVANAGYTTINPGLYNDNGTLSSVTGRYTIQRVYWYPNSATRAYTIYYGTDTYNSLDNAQTAIATEVFTEGINTAGAAILVGFILVKGNATSLSNATDARIIQAGISRGSGTGGGGGGSASPTVPGGLDTYVQFNDGGSTFGGVSGLTFNKITNTLSTTNLVVSNIATVSGNVNLGDTSSDVVTVSGSLRVLNGLQVTGSIIATTGFSGSFLGNLNGTASYATNAATASYVLNAVTASYATVAVSLTTNVFNVALNGTANGVSTNIGGIYIPASTTVTTKSLAYIGGSTVSEVAALKLVPINSVTVSASWVITGTLSSVSLSSPATLGPGWYDLTLETGTVSQTAFGRGLYLTSGDI